MEARRFNNDEERMNAIREYRKKYYQKNCEKIKQRTKEWRAAHGQNRPKGRPKKQDVAVAVN